MLLSQSCCHWMISTLAFKFVSLKSNFSYYLAASEENCFLDTNLHTILELSVFLFSQPPGVLFFPPHLSSLIQHSTVKECNLIGGMHSILDQDISYYLISIYSRGGGLVIYKKSILSEMLRAISDLALCPCGKLFFFCWFPEINLMTFFFFFDNYFFLFEKNWMTFKNTMNLISYTLLLKGFAG